MPEGDPQPGEMWEGFDRGESVPVEAIYNGELYSDDVVAIVVYRWKGIKLEDELDGFVTRYKFVSEATDDD